MFSCMLQIQISLGQLSFELLAFFFCVHRHLAVVSFCVPLPLSCRHRLKKSFDYLHVNILTAVIHSKCFLKTIIFQEHNNVLFQLL